MTICHHCRIGTLRQKTITYANWHAELFVTVPNTPAWQCDVCAYCEVDAAALWRLLVLLGPVTPLHLTNSMQFQQSTTDEWRLAELDPDHTVV